MFDVSPWELLVLGTVALVVIPPKDLPKAMRVAGYWVGRARGVARQFRAGFDDMLRDAELKEMEERWAAENARIMAEHPPTQMLPLSDMTAPELPPPNRPAPAVADHLAEDAPPVLTEAPQVKDAAIIAPAPPAKKVPAPRKRASRAKASGDAQP
jgi:sec-independent protein translocase protein TatB